MVNFSGKVGRFLRVDFLASIRELVVMALVEILLLGGYFATLGRYAWWRSITLHRILLIKKKGG